MTQTPSENTPSSPDQQPSASPPPPVADAPANPPPPPQARPVGAPPFAAGPGWGPSAGPPPGYYPPPWGPPPRRSSVLRPILITLACVFASVILLVVLLVGAIGAMSAAVSGSLNEPGKSGLQTTVIRDGHANQTIAVLYITGLIDEEKAQLVQTFHDQVASDKHVKAVLVRVDTGGGGVSESDQIYSLLKDLREKCSKRLVVSMGGLAASGGYYISCPAEEIWAEPTTITGSIGVIAEWPVLKGTLDKIGVSMVVVRSTNAKAWKQAENPFEMPAAYQLADLQQSIDGMQKRFESVVSTERKSKIKITTAENTYTGVDGKTFTVKEVEPFNGKVFLSDEAKALGLVDRQGYFDDAVASTEALAGLTDARVVQYSPRHGLFSEIGLQDRSSVLNQKTLQQIQTPRIMMLWRVGN
jgi:protease IV